MIKNHSDSVGLGSNPFTEEMLELLQTMNNDPCIKEAYIKTKIVCGNFLHGLHIKTIENVDAEKIANRYFAEHIL